MVIANRSVRSSFAFICRQSGLSLRSIAASIFVMGMVLAAAGVAPVAAQSPVQFFGSFQSYPQYSAQNAQGLVANAQGNLYISGSHAVAYIPVDVNGNPQSGQTLSCSPGHGGNGPASGTGAVTGMAIDNVNNVIFRADLGGPNGEPDVEEIALSGPNSTECTFSYLGSGWSMPSSVTVDSSSNVYVLDAGTGKIVKLAPNGIGGYNQSTVYTNSELDDTTGLSIDSAGNFYVASGFNYGYSPLGSPTATAVYMITNNGGGSYSLPSAIGSGWSSPSATTVDAAGNVWVVDCGLSDAGTNCANGTVNLLVPLGGGSYNQTVYQTISGIRTLMINQAGRIYGFAYGSGSNDAEVWTGGTPPHNLGTYAVGTPAPTVTLTVDFMSAVIADGFNATTQGAYTRDFRVVGGTCTGASYSASQSCTVEVTFTPKAPGLRTGALVVTDESGNVLGTNYLYGTGTGPQAVFSPSTEITLGGGFSSPMGVAVDGNGNAYVVDYTYPTVVTKVPAGCADAGCMTAMGGGFYYPDGVAVDGGGNVYVADYGYQAVKEIPAGCASSSCVTTLGGGFSGPLGVAVDGSGNVYVADGAGSAVKEMPAGCASSSCVITLGGGFSDPNGVAVDGSGNVYVVDQNIYAVKEMPAGCASSSCVTTLGGGFSTPGGVAVDGSGNVYVADRAAVKEMPAGCSSSSCVTTLASDFTYVRGVTVDGSGNVYVADGNGNEVKEVTRADPPNLTFLAPTTVDTIDTTDGPLSVTVENIGNAPLIFTSSGLTAPGDFPQTAGSGSPVNCANSGTVAAGASCNLSIEFAPLQLGLLDETFGLYNNNLNVASAQQLIGVQGTSTAAVAPVPDTTATAVAINPSAVTAGQAVTITATVTDTNTPLTTPTGTVNFTDTVGSTTTSLPGGAAVSLVLGVATLPSVTLSGAGTHTITATYAGVSNTFAGSSGSGTTMVTPSSNVGTATSAIPVTLTFTAAGTVSSINVLTQGATNLEFKDALTGDTCSVSTAYNIGDACTVNVTFTPAFAGPRYGAVVLEDGSGNVLATAFISGMGTGPQIAFGAGTALGTAMAPTANGVALGKPTGIAMDGAGDLFIADIENSRVVEIPAGGGAAQAITPTVNGIPLNNPAGIAVDGAGDLFIADVYNWRVVEVPAGGGAATVIAPTVNGTPLNNPVDVALDSAGDLIIADTWNNRIVEVSISGATTVIAPTVNGLTLSYPSGIAVDGAGDLFIADTLNNRVVEVPAYGNPASAISPAANGTPLNYPSGIVVDGAGDLFIADTLNNRVVEVPRDGSAATAFAPTINGITLAYPNGIMLNGAGDLFVADHGNSRVVELHRSQPPALSYAPTAVGVESIDSPQTVTVENIGNATMTFSGLSVVADFPLDSSGASVCTSATSLLAGARCTLPIDFTPATAGVKNEFLTLTGDGSLVAQNILLSGNASQGTPTVTWPTASAITYGQTLASSTLSGGGGSVAGSFAFTTPGTVPSAGTAPQGVTFTPTDAIDYNSVTGTVSVTVNIATATVTLGSLAQTYTGSPLSATAITNPTGLTVNFTYNGSSVAPTTAGTYTVVGTISDPNYTGTASGTLVIAKTTSTLTLGSLAQSYTGSPLSATAITNPTGLTVNFTYNGSSVAPTTAGTYTVVGTISDTNYTGTNSGTLVISPATATVTLGSMAQTYTGSPLSATAITNPAGKTVTFTYTGINGTSYATSATPPTAAGSYTVVATISDTNYTGTNSGTLVISPATATVTLGSLAQTYTGSPLSATAITNPSGKMVTFTYTGIGGTSYATSSAPPTAVGSYTVVATISDTNYTGTNSGTLMISPATATVTLGSMAQTYTGSPL